MSKQEYSQEYKTSYNFLTWCAYWNNLKFGVRHTSWDKPALYSSYIKIEKNDEKFWTKPTDKYIVKNYEYRGLDEKGESSYFNRSYFKKGDWVVAKLKDDSDLFE